MNRISPTVKQLLIINIIFYFGSTLSANADFIYSIFSLYFPENPDFQPWQIITHMFMHSKQLFTHILFNMFALWMFGTAVESILGSRNFLFFYITCGLGAGIIQLLFSYYSFYSDLEVLISSGISKAEIIQSLSEPNLFKLDQWASLYGLESVQNIYDIFRTPMVGASGAIMGVLVAFGIYFPESKLMLIFLPIPIKAKYFIPGIILLDLFSAFTGQAIFSPSNTAYIAHLGGALTGFLLMIYWKKNQFNSNRWF
tara:strand:+ start:827 stop:1591 length:765 start_codon:yes stop_codon:yes gene_type:complete